MKNTKKIATAAILSAMLPLGALAQSGTSAQQSGAAGTPHAQTNVGTPTGYKGTGQHGEVKKIKEDKLENKMTAERLIGMKVVDRDGNRIGKVKDIGLTEALPPEFSSNASSSDQGRSGQNTGVSNQAASAASPSVGYPGSGVGRSHSYTGTSRDATTGSAMGQSNTGDVQLFVSTDGDSLLQVPASRASFNAGKDEVKLNIGRSEIDSATEAGERLSSVRE